MASSCSSSNKLLGGELPQGLDRSELTDSQVLEVMSQVPREEFVPSYLSSKANIDAPLPIGEGQTISQPFIVAFMTQEARVHPGSKVLEIGTGSGYQAAVLSGMGAEVYSVEIVPELSRQASKRLVAFCEKPVLLKVGDGSKGWKKYAPYDAILVTAATSVVPPDLMEQLAVEGRLVLPLRDSDGAEWLTVVTKRAAQEFDFRRLMKVKFVPMTGQVESGMRRPRSRSK